ncbi:MAG TPA: hypothetical protein VEL07_06230 [Planctomycetota bacterium]|nr:hypothetical protein [Planctomycetota bacterium]
MKTLLVILILFADPAHEPLATTVADDLRRVGGENVQVVIGAAAAAELEKRDVKIQDLITSPNIAEHLTTADMNLAVVHLTREDAGGDVVVNTRLWAEGEDEQHVAIAGKGGDPATSVSSGIVRTLAHRLPNARVASPVADDTQLAGLAERRAWGEVLGQIASVPAAERTPRQHYYLVLAYSGMEQRDAAVEALNAMRAAHPDHFLIKAAEAVIPAEAAATAAPEPEPELEPAPTAPVDDSSDTLR